MKKRLRKKKLKQWMEERTAKAVKLYDMLKKHPYNSDEAFKIIMGRPTIESITEDGIVVNHNETAIVFTKQTRK